MQIVEQIAKVFGVDVPSEDADVRLLMRRAARAEDADFSRFTPEAQEYLDRVRIAVRAKKGIPLPPVVEALQVELERDENGDEETYEPIPDDLHIEAIPEVHTIGGILTARSEGRIKLPIFQRNFVWKLKKQSMFIDCVILGVPMPNIMLASESAADDKQILDGFQRISTLEKFKFGKLKTGTHLKGYEGLRFDQLPVELQNRFLNRKIIVQDIRGGREHWPFVFRMLNIGGTVLNAMEIRRCTFPHAFLGLLEEITENHKTWKALFGENNRYLGLQAVLRAYGMHESYKVYSKPMDSFLDTYCETLARFTKEQLHTEKVRLDFVLEMLHDGVGPGALRLADNKPVNLGLVDVMFHAAFIILGSVGKNASVLKLGEQLAQVRVKILESPDILYSLTHDTSGRGSVDTRLVGVEKIVEQILHTSQPVGAGSKTKS